MAVAIRLTSRSGASPPASPRRIRTLRCGAAHRPTSPSLGTGSATSSMHAMVWRPGDPIRFAGPSSSSTADAQAVRADPSTSRIGRGGVARTSSPAQPVRRDEAQGWQFGDPIRFSTSLAGSTKARNDTADPRDAGTSPVKKQARTSSPSNRQTGRQSSPGSWIPKSWNASSPLPLDRTSNPASRVPLSPPVPRLTQEDLDLLVEGIDFDDDFGREFDNGSVVVPLVQHPARAPPTLSQDELDALVAGIDFTQDIEIDEEAGNRSEQPATRAPETPPRTASTSSGTPRSSRRDISSSASATLSRTSSLLEILSQQSPAPSPLPGLRGYSTVPAIDLCSSSPVVSQERVNESPVPKPHNFTGSGANELAESDEEIVIVSRTRREEASTTRVTVAETASVIRSEPSAVPGFFTRPPNLRDAPRPVRPPSPEADRAPRPTDARALARFKRDSKASIDAERQAQFRQRWPRTFSYKTWNKDARLVYTSSEAVVEKELREMTGPLGFDLEWDSFSGYRKQGKTALAQVCDEKTILLIHVAKMKRFPPALQRLAEDPTRIKLGVQIAGDASKLQRDFSIRSQGTLDINALVHHYDPSRYVGRQRKGLIGLQELTGLYLDQFLRKETAVRTGRWSAALGAQQMEYAANDVYASVQVVRQIQALASVPPERLDQELLELSRRPFNHWTGFGVVVPPVASSSRSPTSPTSQPDQRSVDLSQAPAPAPTTPEEVLSQRKLEAFSLFHRHELPISEITTRMSATRPVKPVTVVWNLLGAHATLAQHDISVAWDLSRLVAAMDDIGDWPERMLAEHGELAGGLREKHAAGVSSDQ